MKAYLTVGVVVRQEPDAAPEHPGCGHVRSLWERLEALGVHEDAELKHLRDEILNLFKR